MLRTVGDRRDTPGSGSIGRVVLVVLVRGKTPSAPSRRHCVNETAPLGSPPMVIGMATGGIAFKGEPPSIPFASLPLIACGN